MILLWPLALAWLQILFFPNHTWIRRRNYFFLLWTLPHRNCYLQFHLLHVDVLIQRYCFFIVSITIYTFAILLITFFKIITNCNKENKSHHTLNSVRYIEMLDSLVNIVPRSNTFWNTSPVLLLTKREMISVMKLNWTVCCLTCKRSEEF